MISGTQGLTISPRSTAAMQTKCAAQPNKNGTGFDTALNPCVAAVRPSKTMLLSDLASSLRESGVDVVSLAAGEPDFDTPQEIIDAGFEALRYEWTHCMLITLENCPLSIEHWAARLHAPNVPGTGAHCGAWCTAGLESPTTHPMLAQEPSEPRL